MILLPLAAALLLLALPGWAGRLGRGSDPRRWARSAALALSTGAFALEGTLLLAASPVLLRTLGAPGLAAACQRAVERLVPGGPVVGWLAAATALVLAVRAGWGVRRVRVTERALRVEPWLGIHHRRPGYDLVVLPTAEPVALSLPGRRGQVLVSEGLIEALRPLELEALLAHERAHLRHGHQRYLVLAEAVEEAAGFLPWVRRSAAALRLALERWADEEAGRATVGGRGAVLRALHRVVVSAPRGVGAFGAAETVLERTRALAAPPPVPGWPLRLVSLTSWGLVLGVLASWGAWAGEAGSVLAAGPLCLI